MHGGLSHFKATLQRRKERNHSKDRSAIKRMADGGESNKEGTNFNFPEMSADELQQFRHTLTTQRKFRERRDIIITIAVTLILFLTLYFI